MTKDTLEGLAQAFSLASVRCDDGMLLENDFYFYFLPLFVLETSDQVNFLFHLTCKRFLVIVLYIFLPENI